MSKKKIEKMLAKCLSLSLPETNKDWERWIGKHFRYNDTVPGAWFIQPPTGREYDFMLFVYGKSGEKWVESHPTIGLRYEKGIELHKKGVICYPVVISDEDIDGILSNNNS